MVRGDGIGLRVARWRDLAGLTQQQLGDTVGVSGAYISMIENGRRAVTKRSLLHDLAAALGVGVDQLTGQPYEPRSRADLVVSALAAGLRTAIDEDPAEGAPPVPAAELARDVQRLSYARTACDFDTMLALGPRLVAQSRPLAEAGVPAGLAAHARAAGDMGMVIKSYGYADLAVHLADAARASALRLGDPGHLAAADVAVAQCAYAADSVRRSLRVSTVGADAAGDGPGDRTLSLYGMLRLQAALCAAVTGRTSDVDGHLAEAESAAARVTSDPWLHELTPTNVDIWRVYIAVENGEPERAPEFARRIDPTRIRSLERRVALHLDTGRGCYAAGQHRQALRRFLAADDLAPLKVRHRSVVHEIVRQMLRDARRGGPAELRELAVRLSLDPVSPDHEPATDITTS